MQIFSERHGTGVSFEGTYVIYSANEAATSSGAGFWSESGGWVELEQASLFTDEEQIALPASVGGDAKLVPASDFLPGGARSIKTYFVTRHTGAIEWAKTAGFQDAQLVVHFDPAVVEAGDTVIGTLPVHLIAAVNARGGVYYHLTMDLPPEARGKELTAEEMVHYGACIAKYTAFAGDEVMARLEVGSWDTEAGEYILHDEIPDRCKMEIKANFQGCTVHLASKTAKNQEVYIEHLGDSDQWRINVADEFDIVGFMTIDSDGSVEYE